MPQQIVDRANEILAQLEQKHIESDVDTPKKQSRKSFEKSEGTGIETSTDIENPKSEIEYPLSIESKNALQSKIKGISKPMQMNIFDIGDPRLQRIKDALDKMDLNTMTPIELMMKVAEWKKMLDN